MFINASTIPMKTSPSFAQRRKANRALRFHQLALAAAGALALSACGGGGRCGRTHRPHDFISFTAA